jgi:hypothetical protein
MSVIKNNSKSIVKESQDMIQDFLRTVVKKVNFRERPFETIFGAIGPILGWKMFGGKIGLLLLIGEYVGFGPGRLGGLIDEELNWKPGQALSLGALKSVANNVVDKIKGAIGIKATSMLKDIMEIKGTIDDHDLVAIAYVNKYFPQKNIEKQAIGRGGYFRRFLRALKGGKKLGFANVLYGLLKLFVSGLAGLGLVGAVSGLAKRHFGLGLPEEGESPFGGLFGKTTPSKKPGVLSRGNLYIKNEKGSVEDTLIHFLDSTIEGFSKAFQQVKGRPLKGSPEMQERLRVIEKLNNKNIWELNGNNAFIIPPIMIVAKSLLPEARYEKMKAPAVSTTKEKPKGAPAKKLQELLQGA